MTAHPGGDRWRWESRIFGSAYDDVSARQGRAGRHRVGGGAPSRRRLPR
ncbi:DUF3626 domain-containing protein [Streptosporangium sp. NBC_01639]|nr:DUF3626 domain-containing protein [Streptosporangium sp. NBC_01639]